MFLRAIASSLLLFSFSSLAQTWFYNEQNADLMVSGVGFNNSGGSLIFNHPSGLATDGTNLILCDRFNNRVLIWNTAPTVWNAEPDLVLGQPNFTANNPDNTRGGMNWPGNASVGSNGKLAITDTYNHRILLWTSFPDSNGQPADVVLNLYELWVQKGSPAPGGWGWPWGVWTDGTKLAVVSTYGATILFWNTFPTSDNQLPDYTITHQHFGTPRNISTDGSTYFMVGDHNAKVNGDRPGTFYWNSYPTTQNQQYSFYRDDWIKGAKLPDGKFIAGGLDGIFVWDSLPKSASDAPKDTIRPEFYNNGDGPDVVLAGGKIYVNNYNGNNVYVYNSIPTKASPNPNFAISVSDYKTTTLTTIGYIQNPCFATDGKRLIVCSDFDRKIYIYNSFPAKSGVVYDHVIQTNRIPLDIPPWDIACHNNKNKLVAVGRFQVAIWDVNSIFQNQPLTYNNNIGSATFSELRGVALDDSLFYVADYNGKVYIWKGIPASQSINPYMTLDFGNSKMNRLSSDGTYFTVTIRTPADVYIYKVSDLLEGKTTPFKKAEGSGLGLNLPGEAITFNGSLAIANTVYNTVLIWKNLNDYPDTSKMIVLGNSKNLESNPPKIGQNRLFWPATLLYHNYTLWVGETKFSSRILRFSHSAAEDTVTISANDTSTHSAASISIKFTKANSGNITLLAKKYLFSPGGNVAATLKNPLDNYWSIALINGTINGELSLTIDISSINGISDTEKIHLLKRRNSEDNWEDLGKAVVISGTKLTWSGLTDFSEFGLAMEKAGTTPIPADIAFYYVSGTEHGIWLATQNGSGKWSRGQKVKLDNTFDANSVDPDIIKTEDGKYRLYYFKGWFTSTPPHGEPSKIYCAISDDGVNFTTENLAFQSSDVITDPSVVRLPNGSYLMALSKVTPQSNNIIFASSTDGISFQQLPSVITNGGIPELSVLDNGNVRVYFPRSGGIGSYISTDKGQTWMEEQGLRLSADLFVGDPSVIKVSDTLWLLFVKGLNNTGLTDPIDPIGHNVRLATSKDGNVFNLMEDIILDSASVPEGLIINATTSIFGNLPEIGNKLHLEQNYPNPFNSVTKIRFSIPDLGIKTIPTKLNIIDLAGKEVITLINEPKSPGKYEIIFNGRKLAGGVYFYRLQAGNMIKMKKFILKR